MEEAGGGASSSSQLILLFLALECSSRAPFGAVYLAFVSLLLGRKLCGRSGSVRGGD